HAEGAAISNLESPFQKLGRISKEPRHGRRWQQAVGAVLQEQAAGAVQAYPVLYAGKHVPGLAPRWQVVENLVGGDKRQIQKHAKLACPPFVALVVYPVVTAHCKVQRLRKCLAQEPQRALLVCSRPAT